MCNHKCYQTIAVVVSILVGIAVAICSIKLGFTSYMVPRLAILFGALALVLVTLTASSLLRQDRAYEACICHCGRKVVGTAIALLVVASIALIALEVSNNNILRDILAFLLGALLSGTAFSAGGMLLCLVQAGCPRCTCNHEP